MEVARLSGSGRRRRKLLVIGEPALVRPAPAGAHETRSLSTAIQTTSRASDEAGVEVDVAWGLAPALRAIGASSSPWRLWRYDAVVIAIGTEPTPLGALRTQRLLAGVLAAIADAGRLVIVLAAPTSRTRSGRGARERRRRLGHLLEQDGQPSVMADLTEDGELQDPGGLASVVLEALHLPAVRPEESSSEPSRVDPEDEESRQTAVDRSVRDVEGAGSGLQRVVLLAKNSFDVPYAQINLVDRGRLRSLAFVGRSSDDLTESLSGVAVRRDSALLIPDTQADSRFAHIPETHGDAAIRFYAGYPLESLDGYRIGVLCVLDVEPHPIEPDDDVLLRDVALLAEAELIALTGRGAQDDRPAAARSAGRGSGRP